MCAYINNVCVCMRACVHACVRACVRACVCTYEYGNVYYSSYTLTIMCAYINSVCVCVPMSMVMYITVHTHIQ